MPNQNAMHPIQSDEQTETWLPQVEMDLIKLTPGSAGRAATLKVTWGYEPHGITLPPSLGEKVRAGEIG
jgi:hypothetical protein